MQLTFEQSEIFWENYNNHIPWKEKLQHYHFEDGMQLVIEDFILEKRFSFPYKKKPQDYLECIYCLSGQVMLDGYNKNLMEDSQPRSFISWQSCGEGIFRIEPFSSIKVIHIYCTKKFLAKYLGLGEASIEHFTHFFAAKDKFFGKTDYISPFIETLVYQILNCSLNIIPRRLFLHAKVMEILALEVDSWISRHHKINRIKETFFASEEIAALEKARNILMHQYQTPPSLSDLAHQVGFNKNKLTKGFRKLFGNTVYASLTSYRLEKAKQLLDSGENNVSETAIAVGYSNIGHFSKLFQARYGILPHNYLHNIRILKNNHTINENQKY